MVFGRTGPLRSPQGLFMGWQRYLNPYGAHKLIMHALNTTGPVRRGKIRTVSHGSRTGLVRWRTIFVQNSPGTAREQPVRGPEVWCDWGISGLHNSCWWPGDERMIIFFSVFDLIWQQEVITWTRINFASVRSSDIHLMIILKDNPAINNLH